MIIDNYLEGYAEKRNDDVSRRQIGDIVVCDIPHGLGEGDDHDDEGIAADGHEGDGAVGKG